MRSTNPNKSRKVLHDISPDAWLEARARWKRLYINALSPNSTHLKDFQMAFWGKLEENAKSVIGEPILVVARPTGGWLTTYPYPATILKVTEEGGQWVLTCLYQPIEEEHWDAEKIVKVYIHQILPLIPNEPLTPEEEKKLKDYLAFATLLKPINDNRNGELTRLKSEKQSYEASLDSLNRDIQRYRKVLETTEKKILEANDQSLTVDDLKQQLDLAARHRKVAWAMYDQSGHILIETSMLYVTNPTTNKEDKRKPVGRFAFKITPRDASIYAQNLDYGSPTGHRHPNLNSDHICLGGNDGLVRDLILKGDFYALIDFMVLFFALFPQDNGSPYTDPMAWLRTKVVEPRENSYRNANTAILYIATKTEEDLARKVHKKKKAARKKKVEKTEEITLPTPLPLEAETVVDDTCPNCECNCVDCGCMSGGNCVECNCNNIPF
jgi:hypothetical protein